MTEIARTVASVAFVCVACALWPASAADQSVPNFSPDSTTGWIAAGQEFLAPASGPGPVTFDPARRPVPGRPAFRVADLSNPILQSWTREELQKANARALSGRAAYTPKERCWPIGVPGFVLYPVFPTYFIQTAEKVVMIWAEDHQVRRIYLNQPHAARVTPSWFGESVGRYEGDTLVVDTIGQNDKSAVDAYRTPHTTKIHVVERYRVINGGKGLDTSFTVDDPDAFYKPWGGRRPRFLLPNRPLNDMDQICAAGNEDHFDLGLDPVPQEATPDF